MRTAGWLLPMLGACTGAPGTSDDSSTPTNCGTAAASAEVGTGESSFIALRDGDEVPLIHGPQGGNHILGAIRLLHMDAVALIHYSLARVTTGELVSDQTYRIQLVEEGGCAVVAVNLYGYVGFIGEQDPSQTILWTEILMRMEATDTSGRTAVDEVIIIPRPDEEATTNTWEDDTGTPPETTPPA